MTDINFLNSSISLKVLLFKFYLEKIFLFLLFYSLGNLLTFLSKSFIFLFIVYSFLILLSILNFRFTFNEKFLNFKFLQNLFFFNLSNFEHPIIFSFIFIEIYCSKPVYVNF